MSADYRAASLQPDNKRIAIAVMVSRAEREWFRELDRRYLERQYAALHIRRFNR